MKFRTSFMSDNFVNTLSTFVETNLDFFSFFVEHPKLMKAVKVVLFNQLVVGIPSSCAVYFVMKYRGCVIGAHSYVGRL